jgi:hypothetical protein
MKKYEVYVSTYRIGSRVSTTIEVDDDISVAALEEDARDAMFNLIEWGFRPLDDGEE